MTKYALAVDIGASSGRHMLGCVRDGRICLEEVYRFPNEITERNGHLCWDVEELYAQILAGLRKCAELGKLPDTMSIDTWGVDYVLLDGQGKQLGDAVAYRDGRTVGMDAVLSQTLPYAELYARTGIAKQPYNTLYQMMAEFREHPGYLERAERFLFMPCYLSYLLCGVAKNEYTIASTSALLNAETRTWDAAVLGAAGLPAKLFREPPAAPGTVLGPLRPELARELGFCPSVMLAACHDTAGAFLAMPVRDAQTAFLSSGTWSLLGVESAAPILTPEAREAGFTNEGGYGGKIRFLRNIMGMWIPQCIRKEWGKRYAYAEMAELAREGTAYPHVFDVLDERFLAPQSMLAQIYGWLAEHALPLPMNDAELLCCVYRSLARCYAASICQLEQLTDRHFTTLSIVGGGSGNNTLNQWAADETGLRVLAGPSESTALGCLTAQLQPDAATLRLSPEENPEIRVYLPQR
ncbi:MAG: rhamnulokinase family protein [Clostridia bacterium]